MFLLNATDLNEVIERVMELLSVSVKAKIIGKLHAYDFKIKKKADNGEYELIEGALHLDVCMNISARTTLIEDIDILEKELLGPMVTDLSDQINNSVKDCNYLLIPLALPEWSLAGVEYTDNIGIRIVKGYNMRYCCTQLSMDIALIEEKAYLKLKPLIKN